MKYLAIAAIAALSIAAPAATDVTAKDAYAKLKGLIGTWEQKDSAGHKFTITYRLTGAGSALMEVIAPGTGHEMVTMYHLDKDRLMMTHYCSAQNQPTLRLMPGSTADMLHFVFVSGTNMVPTDMHIHDVKFKFVGKDHVIEDWLGYSDGKPGELQTFDLHRAG